MFYHYIYQTFRDFRKHNYDFSFVETYVSIPVQDLIGVRIRHFYTDLELICTIFL